MLQVMHQVTVWISQIVGINILGKEVALQDVFLSPLQLSSPSDGGKLVPCKFFEVWKDTWLFLEVWGSRNEWNESVGIYCCRFQVTWLLPTAGYDDMLKHGRRRSHLLPSTDRGGLILLHKKSDPCENQTFFHKDAHPDSVRDLVGPPFTTHSSLPFVVAKLRFVSSSSSSSLLPIATTFCWFCFCCSAPCHIHWILSSVREPRSWSPQPEPNQCTLARKTIYINLARF